MDDLRPQAAATIGTDGYQELFAGGTVHLSGDRRLLVAGQLGHYDGPWQPGQNFRKVNAIVRYSQGSATDGFSLTGYFPYFRRGVTRGMVEDLVDPQKEKNKRRSAEVEVVSKMANGG